MDKLLEKLSEYGADIDCVNSRFLGDIDLYKSCFDTFLSDENFLQLGEAIKACDYERACDCAHTLKGIAGNMGITPLYQDVCIIVENLRKNNYYDLNERYSKILEHLSK
ncbi:MAG: Hpt domain-containing protein, partial [Clostridia bacterium]